MLLMEIFKGIKVFLIVLLSIVVLFAIILGVGFGLLLADTYNLDLREYQYSNEVKLPSRALDINGELIYEYVADEKRKIITLDDVPKHFIHAVISREDEDFFKHKGVDFFGTAKATIQYVIGNSDAGASTINQQVIRLMGLVPRTLSVSRKVKEIWYALLLDKQFSKQEILEYFINNSYFNKGTYGVEAASQFYWGHSAKKLTIGESAMLVIALSNATQGSTYNPYVNREVSADRQKDVLNKMIENGYLTQEEADNAFEEYWKNFDYARTSEETAYKINKSKAPHFTEFVRLEIRDNILGTVDVYTSGLTIQTTLDLRAQKVADTVMQEAYKTLNKSWKKDSSRRSKKGYSYVPLIELLALSNDIGGLDFEGSLNRSKAKTYYDNEFNSVLELLTLSTLDVGVNSTVKEKRISLDTHLEKTTIEGALLSIDTHTGEIIALVGGQNFNISKLNRAMDASVMPGSAFKPLYYSGAIKSRQFNQATFIKDSPVVYVDKASGEEFAPENYNATMAGSVLLWQGIAKSLNIPSVHVLDTIGYDTAFDTASKLLGMPEKADDREVFPHSLAAALGVNAVSPYNMVQAYSTIANKGRQVIPYGIKYVKDRNGDIIYSFEEKIKEEQTSKPEKEVQILTLQESYIMITLLQGTTSVGTLRYPLKRAGWDFDKFNIGGKTGTTQNWGDAWAIGFTQYYTTAVWFGFDKPGQSLGKSITGATAAGPRWARFMKAIHEDKPEAKFQMPGSGIIKRNVCATYGMLYNPGVCTPHPYYGGSPSKYLYFLTGTEPTELCTKHIELVEHHEATGGIKDIISDPTPIVPVNTSISSSFIDDMKEWVVDPPASAYEVTEPSEINSDGSESSIPIDDGTIQDPGDDTTLSPEDPAVEDQISNIDAQLD